MRSKYLVSYEARIDKELQGVAFFDTHVVRTQPETVMVAISPKGVILRTEVVQFREPQEYAAPERWTRQLVGQTPQPAPVAEGGHQAARAGRASPPRRWSTPPAARWPSSRCSTRGRSPP